MITIRAFKAVDEPHTCELFLKGHRKVLEQFNLENISTNTPRWITHPNTYVYIAEQDGELLGGVRMQIADGNFPLPAEDAVSHMDPKIHDLVNEKSANGGASELCGLWNARTLPPSLGLTKIMSYAAVSTAEKIKTKHVFAVCAGYTLYTAMRLGMVIQKSVGNNGEFVYPNSNFRARVLCMDAYSLETSSIEFKESMLALKNNPNLVLHIPTENVEIQFNLSTI
jgi:hypothetical protein